MTTLGLGSRSALLPTPTTGISGRVHRYLTQVLPASESSGDMIVDMTAEETSGSGSGSSSLDEFLANLDKVTKPGRSIKVDIVAGSSSDGGVRAKRSLSDMLASYEGMENSRRITKNPRNLSASLQHMRLGVADGGSTSDAYLPINREGGMMSRNEPCSVRDDEGLVKPKGTIVLGQTPVPTRIVPPSA
ncbi:expressed unknown protein [Seminavis robusta]|uniref:Uncharacterized protein n=1 Tax=Seminavis robusta TaxID=568900 RepID=A0A9N8H8N4_9STRA|nr:expressed unknown protein [Seminavis robusta]|eukprot:Sro175_g077120.1 n/a (189) ;mRNA; f:73359-73925